MDYFKNATSIEYDEIDPIEDGRTHDTYSILSNSGDKYFMKSAGGTELNLEKLRNEADSIENLQKESVNIYIPEIVESSFTDKRGYIVMPFYEHSMMDWENEDSVRILIKDCANYLREMHKINISKADFNYEEFKRSDFESWMNDFEDSTIERISDSVYDEYVSVVKESCQWIRDDDNRQNVLMHGDYHLPNIRINEDGSIRKVVDLDRVSIMDRAYEIAKTEIRITDLYASHTPMTREELIDIFRDEYSMESSLIDRVEAYKSAYIVRTAEKMRNKSVFDTWLSVGTREECIRRHDELVKEINRGQI